MRGDHRHCVQRIQLPVAAAHLIFGAPLLGHVEHETLIAFDVAGSIASGEATLNCQKQSAVLAAQRNVEIPDVVLAFDFLAEGFALLGIDTDFRVQIEDQQFFALAVAEHVHESVIAIDEVAGRVSDVYAFLHLLK